MSVSEPVATVVSDLRTRLIARAAEQAREINGVLALAEDAGGAETKRLLARAQRLAMDLGNNLTRLAMAASVEKEPAQ